MIERRPAATSRITRLDPTALQTSLGAALQHAACLVVDPDCLIEAFDPLAERLLERHRILGLGAEGRLVCRSPRHAEDLRHAVRQVAGGRRIETHVFYCDGEKPCACVRALMVVADRELPPSRVLLALMDEPACLATKVVASPIERLGLTAAETRIATRLVDGRSPREIAAELGVGVSTVRTHLARIFAKTGTSRQAELVSFLLDRTGRGRSSSRDPH